MTTWHAPTTITRKSARAWEVECPAGTGSVETGGRGLRVYVDQPGRSHAVGDDRFAALDRDLDGVVTRVPGTTDEHYQLAVAVLDTFTADPAYPGRVAEGRCYDANELRSEYDRLERNVTAIIHRQQRRLADVAAAREHLDTIGDDPSVPLPFFDAVPHAWRQRELDEEDGR